MLEVQVRYLAVLRTPELGQRIDRVIVDEQRRSMPIPSTPGHVGWYRHQQINDPVNLRQIRIFLDEEIGEYRSTAWESLFNLSKQ